MQVHFDSISKVYPATRNNAPVNALSHLDVTINSGEFVSLVGPSGCGKTTLLDILLGVHEPSTGQVLLDGVPRSDVSTRPGVVLQSAALLPWRNVLSNVMLPAQVGKAPQSIRSKEMRDRAQGLLELMGIGDFGARLPNELSGGMQQRVAIARALFMRSTLMCFDEPFSALDEFTREALNIELQRIWTEEGFTAVFVTHNIQEAVLLSDRVIVMAPRPGRVVEDVKIDLPRPRSLAMTTEHEFAELVGHIRATLRTAIEEAA